MYAEPAALKSNDSALACQSSSSTIETLPSSPGYLVLSFVLRGKIRPLRGAPWNAGGLYAALRLDQADGPEI
jgi:hypothetical protein